MSNACPKRNYDTAARRWAGVGPYYAMFPVSFADSVVNEYTNKGDWVLDPFAGRGTALFSAATQERFGLGFEINPVGWVYGRAKLQTASRGKVEDRIRWLGAMRSRYTSQAAKLPEFFKHCYCSEIRKFLLAARSLLDWRRCKVDWTTMALILIDLHGKRENALSNQMRQTKAMSPLYAIRWWNDRDLVPPEVDPVEFLLKKVAWRYAKGRLELHRSRVYLGDSRALLARLRGGVGGRGISPAQLLLTSPPYHGVTNYFYDQWLRLWLLGGPAHPQSPGDACKRKFASRQDYLSILRSVFMKSKHLLAPDAVIYVRTDARDYTLKSTLQVLKEVFPKKTLRHERHSIPSFSQTALFDVDLESAGDVDLVLW
jgi:DNA methylase